MEVSKGQSVSVIKVSYYQLKISCHIRYFKEASGKTYSSYTQDKKKGRKAYYYRKASIHKGKQEQKGKKLQIFRKQVLRQH